MDIGLHSTITVMVIYFLHNDLLKFSLRGAKWGGAKFEGGSWGGGKLGEKWEGATSRRGFFFLGGEDGKGRRNRLCRTGSGSSHLFALKLWLHISLFAFLHSLSLLSRVILMRLYSIYIYIYQYLISETRSKFQGLLGYLKCHQRHSIIMTIRQLSQIYVKQFNPLDLKSVLPYTQNKTDQPGCQHLSIFQASLSYC